MKDDTISRAAAIETVRKAQSIGQAHRMLVQLPSAQPDVSDTYVGNMVSKEAVLDEIHKYMEERDYTIGELHDRICELPPAQPEREDAVPRTSVEYICRKNTVSTNPYEHKYHDKFMQFMDDPEISDFGRWQHSNGFNTALVAVRCDLNKVPSVTPSAQPGWIPCDSGKFPEESGTYTVTAYDGATKRVTYAKYQKRLKRWELAGARAYWRVLAWMPHIEPYKEKQDE